MSIFVKSMHHVKLKCIQISADICGCVVHQHWAESVDNLLPGVDVHQKGDPIECSGTGGLHALVALLNKRSERRSEFGQWTGISHSCNSALIEFRLTNRH